MSVGNHSTPFPFFVALCPIQAVPRHVSWIQGSIPTSRRIIPTQYEFQMNPNTNIFRDARYSSLFKPCSRNWGVSWQLCSVCLFQLVACSGSMPSNISWRHNSFRPSGLLFSWERNHQNLLDSFYTIWAVRHVSTNESTSLLFTIQSEGRDYTRSSALPPACPIVLCDCPGSEEMILM